MVYVMYRLRKIAGFTLIELMMVVAILGILAVVSMPRFAKMVQKANEARGKGNLVAIRGSMRIYYADNEGNYYTPAPGDDKSLDFLVPLYIEAIPEAYTGQKIEWGTAGGFYHEGKTRSNYNPTTYTVDNVQPYEWYWNEMAGNIVWINCSLQDTRNNYITSW